MVFLRPMIDASGQADFRVRRAELSDASAIAQVHTRVWQQAYRNLLSARYLDQLDWTNRLNSWQDSLRSSDSGEATFVGLRRQVVVGFASSGPARDSDMGALMAVELYAIYLESAEWGTGSGDKLLAAALESAENVVVALWVFEENTRARHFYEKHGFRPDGTRSVMERDGLRLSKVRYRRVV